MWKKQSFLLLFLVPLNIFGGRDSSVGIATGYGMDGRGHRIPVGGENFRPHPDRPWGPPSLLYNGYRVFPGVERPGRGADYPTLLAPGQERVELYFYPPLGLQISYMVSSPLPLPLYVLWHYAALQMEINWTKFVGFPASKRLTL
jgi:hypothetical protein